MYGKALAALAAFGLMTGAVAVQGAVQAADAPKPSADTITGKVASAKGPEAGVWVIAETTGLPTKFVKIVVTDDQGRYLLPSRLSAEEVLREKRQAALEKVASDGFIADYSGIRIARSGRRFRISDAVVWQLIDRDGVLRGQAATFSDWGDV